MEDKASCSLVCKAWRKPFQKSMYSDFIVKDNSYLIKWCSKFMDPECTIQKTGHLLRSLHLNYCPYVKSGEIYALQKTFQNIKYLSLEKICLNPSYVGGATNWSLWKTLTDLRINLGGRAPTRADNILLEIVSNLPLLKQLKLTGRYYFHAQPTFTLSDSELIHERLLHLNHLELSSAELTFSKTDLERMTKVLPAKKIKAFGIESKNIDHRWLCYFVRKYPSLESLRLSISNERVEPEEHRNDIICQPRDLPHSFQHLKKLSFGDISYHYKEYLLFLDMFTYCKLPLEQLSICSQEIIDDSNTPQDLHTFIKVMELCSTQFSETLKVFTFEYYDKNPISIDMIIEGKDAFRNLVHLHVHCALVNFKLDVLFDTKVCLEFLHLSFTNICINPSPCSGSKKHVLRSFKVYRATITSDVLRYLSFHCRKMDTLYLHKTKISGPFNSTTGCQYIDMSYTRFKILHIHNTEFIISNNPISKNNHNITLITRPVNDTHPKSYEITEDAQKVIEELAINMHYHWFYILDDIPIKGLSKSQSNAAKRFFDDFKNKKKNAIKTSFDGDRTREPRLSWKMSCAYGYTKVKCGYVNNCDIHIN